MAEITASMVKDLREKTGAGANKPETAEPTAEEKPEPAEPVTGEEAES